MMLTAVRLPPALIRRLDAAVERERARRRGERYTRSDLVRTLLGHGLDVLDARQPPNRSQVA